MTDINRDDFLRWAYSNLLSNRERGILAEYIVARCLNAASGHRTEWDACDIRTSYGARVEVKSSAYLQSWQQNKLSKISFDIAKKKGWDAEANTYVANPVRYSDIYVFCVLAETDRSLVNPLSTNQWQFFVVSTDLINAQLGDQQSLTLSRLKTIAGASISYHDLAAAVRANYALHNRCPAPDSSVRSYVAQHMVTSQEN